MGVGRPQDDLRQPKTFQDGPRSPPDISNMIDSPKTAQASPKSVLRLPETAPRRPKTAPSHPKTAAGQPKNRRRQPKRGPRRPQYDTKIVKNALRWPNKVQEGPRPRAPKRPKTVPTRHENVESSPFLAKDQQGHPGDGVGWVYRMGGDGIGMGMGYYGMGCDGISD